MRGPLPDLVLADKRGRIFVYPRLKALGRAQQLVVPDASAWVPLPKGSTLFLLPGHRAFGWDPAFEEAAPVPLHRGEEVFPVAAFPVPGFLRLFFPAALKRDKKTVLPLWPYTAVGWRRGCFVIAAQRIEPLCRQQPRYYEDTIAIERGIREFEKRFPANRLVRHLARCSRDYNCRNAQDLFLMRGEAPLPVSPTCNARCLGCLSSQEEGGAASQERIGFVPSAEEIAEITVAHLRRARSAIASFGQGCEGEPLLQFGVVERALALIRRRTSRGTLHMNTNGYSAQRLAALRRAGLDSVRISVNSLDPARYAAYYRPRGYRLADVLNAVRQAHASGLFVSLNYLVLPGHSDTPQETGRLFAFLKKGYVNHLQLRNWCGDPEEAQKALPPPAGPSLGVDTWLGRIRRSFPGLMIGCLNTSRRRR